jgi:hypothetical protein
MAKKVSKLKRKANKKADEKPDLSGHSTTAMLAELARRFPEEPFFRLLNTLRKNLDEPRLQVLVTHGIVELLINTMIDAKCKNAKKITDNNRDFPHSTKLTILNELGILSDHHYTLLNWFRKLRNEAAHQPFFELTKDKLELFADGKLRDPATFASTCFNIVLDLWRAHEEIVSIVLMPNLYEEVETDQLMVEVPAAKHLMALKSDPEKISLTPEQYSEWKQKQKSEEEDV